MDREFELVVIGTGAAGSAAAEKARSWGHSVAIIEKDRLGGSCPNYACIPTKALLRSAHVYSLLKRASDFGLHFSGAGFDWNGIVNRKDRIVHGSGAATMEERFREMGIHLFRGAATFEDGEHVRVDGQVLTAGRVLIATGSQPALPRIAGIGAAKPITSRDAIGLSELPASMIVVGAGPVGCEFAQLFSTFDVPVALLEAQREILPGEEPELAALVRRSLESNGVTVLTRAHVLNLASDGRKKRVRVAVEQALREFSAEEILIATGREADVSGLNLEAAGVETEDGRIRVNEYLASSNPRIFAAGDAAGPYLYTHFASYQGSLVPPNMFSKHPKKADYRVVPRVTFTEPEIASVGLTESKAEDEGYHAKAALYPIAALGKALVDSEDRGMVKLVADSRSGEILGGHIVAPHAGEMIHAIATAMQVRAQVKDLAETIYAFPTYAQAINAAAGEWVEAHIREQEKERHA
ncbi:MAG: NAD(P)/FAD-dependent oxidoreductase [Bryobacteraceae bacterium]